MNGSTMLRSGAGISRIGRGELGQIIARGKRLVEVHDVVDALGVDRVTAAKKLARWTEQGWLRRVRRGLYIPVPLDAENPSAWSEDPLVLADAVWSPCYFTGWTAANHWGLTEQIFQTVVLKTTKRVRSSRERLLDFEYILAHVSSESMTWSMNWVWRDDLRVQVADPARTVIDILDRPDLGGGIRETANILASFLDDHDWHALVDYGDRLGNGAVFKRLGYLVEATGLDRADLLDECHARLTAGISLLDPARPPVGRRISRWSLLVNVEVGAREAS